MSIFKSQRRWIYGALFLTLAFVEVLIALFVRDAFVRPYLGDVLIVILLCCFIRTLFPKGTQFLALHVFLFASVVEVGQYFNYAAWLGLDSIPFFHVLLGSTFSAADLVCYAVGCGVFFAVENVVLSFLEKKPTA